MVRDATPAVALESARAGPGLAGSRATSHRLYDTTSRAAQGTSRAFSPASSLTPSSLYPDASTGWLAESETPPLPPFQNPTGSRSEKRGGIPLHHVAHPRGQSLDSPARATTSSVAYGSAGARSILVPDLSHRISIRLHRLGGARTSVPSWPRRPYLARPTFRAASYLLTPQPLRLPRSHIVLAGEAQTLSRFVGERIENALSSEFKPGGRCVAWNVSLPRIVWGEATGQGERRGQNVRRARREQARRGCRRPA